MNIKLKRVYSLLIFVISVATMVMFFPRQGKFRYEYQKGRPWMHQDLIAPYDFPIYKAVDVINAEKEQVSSQFKPFFNFNDSIGINKLTEFKRLFYQKWKGLFIAKEGLSIDFFERDSKEKRKSLRTADSVFRFVNIEISNIYDKGILSTEDIDVIKSGMLFIVSGNQFKEFSINNVYTLQSSYKAIKSHVALFNSNIPYKDFAKEILSNFPYEKFIEANLIYDVETSEKNHKKLLNNVSLFKGMVQQGEKIISKGELVTDGNFQIIWSLKKEYEKELGDSRSWYLVLFGQSMLVALTVIMLYFFLLFYRPELVNRVRHITFLLFLLVLFVVLAGVAVKVDKVSMYVIPFVLIPIFVRTFFDARLALFTHFTAILLVGFFAPNPFEFVFMNFLAGFVAVYTLTNLYHRRKLFLASALVTLTFCFVFVGLNVVKEGNLSNIEWNQMIWFLGSGLLILAAFPLVYVFEKVFNFLSDATLMELSDTNQPLLRRLAQEAPGTFQHSLQVANIAEEAVRLVGGNPLLVRTGALYHDIGKLTNPEYFIENKVGDYNPHDNLTSLESCKFIIKHVNDGLALAKKHKLPVPIKDFIRTHHGDSKVQYFLRTYRNENPEIEINENDFAYSGPKPTSKEQAILMMADAIEASSRTLKSYTHQSIEGLVNSIINYQKSEHQFDDAEITFGDISKVKVLFTKKIINIYHARVEYPEDNK